MDAKVYVYAYLLLSLLYAGGCLQYLNAVTRTVSLAKQRQAAEGELLFGTEEARAATQTAVRAVLGVDSAAFATAVIPVAYVAVTGLLGNLLTRNTASAGMINPLWLVATVIVVAAHMLFLVRITELNSKLRQAGESVLSPSFVSRHASMFTYYRLFILAVTLFNVANSVVMLAQLGSVSSAPYIM
jgi:hypothetical protein